MRAVRRCVALIAGLALALAVADGVRAAPKIDGVAELPPYEMVRTLEYVQDSIVGGDHAAMAMQSYLLAEIDKRLRAAGPAVFEDGRNVDASLIYAMSGGNPATLALLASRDVEGRFDHALTDALARYFSGHQAAAGKELEALQPQFLHTAIGAYVTLVTANAVAREHPEQALKLFDWVRLLAPGSILEESALRRSIYLADVLHRPEKGLDYAESYARRFIRSPYAGQFADLFVRLVVDNTSSITEAQLSNVLDSMDKPRQGQIYLRIARASAIAGETDLAAASAARADALSAKGDRVAATLARFYGDLASVAGPSAGKAEDEIRSISPGDLSDRDQALRAAALALADAVVSPPSRQSIRKAEQAERNAPAPTTHSLLAAEGPAAKRLAGSADTAAGKQADMQLADFVDARRATLKAIDELLGKGGR